MLDTFSYQPFILLSIIVITIYLFLRGFWRYDIVALFALVLSILTGIVPVKNAFSGFSNPAVITVGCIMVITAAISQSKVLDYMVMKAEHYFHGTTMHIASLTFISAALSAFMNNVGALALMMPIAIQTSIKSERSPSLILMPIAFGSVLGGLVTAIGTPPNLLISDYRQEVAGHAFNMFDFTPVGIVVAITGVLFISLIGWRLVPARIKSSKAEEFFQISDYITEIKVPAKSPYIDKTVADLYEGIKADFELIAISHNGSKKFALRENDVIREDDILIVEAAHSALEDVLTAGKFKLAGDKPFTSKQLTSTDITILEAVVPPDSNIEGRSAKSMRLRVRYGINLLALSREGISMRKKLNDIKLNAGDVVLLQGNIETLQETIVSLGFLPLAEREIKLGSNKTFLPIAFFFIAILLAATQTLTISVAFMIAVLAIFIFNVMPVRMLYQSIDWSVLLLLGAFIPIGGAIQTTGASTIIANLFLIIAGSYSPVLALIVLMIVTMTLSDLLNNVATAVLMAPIAANLAISAHVSIDPYLMAVAIGASCSFLTPVAHQNNTMVMGPGGYHFFDYARLGLPLEILILCVAIPMILYVWPLMPA